MITQSFSNHLQFTVTILVYMNDILITRNSSSEIATLIHRLNKAFALKDNFLGVQVQKTHDEIHFSKFDLLSN